MIDFEKYGFDTAPVENDLDEVSDSNDDAAREIIDHEDGFVQQSFDDVEEEPVPTVAAAAPKTPHLDVDTLTAKQPGKANIVVVGVGGGGNNAVNNMIRAGIKSASFLVMNTDVQALNMSLVAPRFKIQLGHGQTGGLGAGSNPEIGRLAAEESREYIKAALKGIDLLFITAGMGGGTGTGAAPIIAEIAKSMGILTVAVVTKPFNFEGQLRMKNAEMGIRNLQNFVDTLLVIPNQKLIDVLDKSVSFKRAFEIADDVLRQGVQGVSDIIANPELINLDFADVKTILLNKGLAHMGIGYGKGEKRVIEAVRGAVCSPLLETDIEGATGIIINVCGGEDMLLTEVTEACDIIRDVVDPSANIIVGTATVPDKKDIEITIIATGFMDKNTIPARVSTNPAVTAAKPVSSVLGEVAADSETERPMRPIYNPDIFADRPQFGAPKDVAPIAPVPAPAQAPTEPEEIQPSRIDVSAVGGRQVPKFLRKIRGDRN